MESVNRTVTLQFECTEIQLPVGDFDAERASDWTRTKYTSRRSNFFVFISDKTDGYNVAVTNDASFDHFLHIF